MYEQNLITKSQCFRWHVLYLRSIFILSCLYKNVMDIASTIIHIIDMERKEGK